MLYLSWKIDSGRIGTAFLIIAWFMGWFVMSTLSGHDVLFSNAHTGLVVSIFCLFLVSGSLLFTLFQKQASYKNYQTKKVSKIFFWFLVPVLAIYFYCFIRTCILVFEKGDSFSHIRHLFFAFPEGGNFWFSHKILWSLFLILSGFVFHFLLVVSVPLFFIKKEKLLFLTFLTIVFLETFTRMSRGLIYSIAICVLYVLFMLYRENRIKIKVKALILSGFLLVFSMAFVSIMRGHNPISGFVRYHTIGFMLLSKLIDKDYFYNASSFAHGRLTFGGFDYLFGILLRGLGDHLYQVPAYYNTFLENKLILLDLKVFGYNSYYTMFSSPYLDAGEFGVGIIGGIVGFFTAKCEFLYKKNNDVIALIWLLFIFYNCIMGIFGATFETPGFWLTLIGLYFYSVLVSTKEQVASEVV